MEMAMETIKILNPRDMRFLGSDPLSFSMRSPSTTFSNPTRTATTLPMRTRITITITITTKTPWNPLGIIWNEQRIDSNWNWNWNWNRDWDWNRNRNHFNLNLNRNSSWTKTMKTMKTRHATKTTIGLAAMLNPKRNPVLLLDHPLEHAMEHPHPHPEHPLHHRLVDRVNETNHIRDPTSSATIRTRPIRRSP